MNQLFHKLRLLILKDVSDEAEIKDLAITLRVLSLIYVIYYLFAAISLALLYHYTHAFLALVCSVLLAGCFISTYDNQTRLSFRLFNIVIISSTVYLTLTTGWNMNFQWNILITILVQFYSFDIKMKTKLRYMKISVALLLAMSVFTHIAPNYREYTELYAFFYQTIHAAFYVTLLCTMAYCYSNKFNLSESKLRRSNQKLIEMASKDALTRLPNRRSMTEHLNNLVYENDRTGKTFCLAIGDVDLFKRINDTYGHDTGDYVLSTLSELFQNNMKGRGMVARWGGEEFLFCFENMNVQHAKAALEVLRLQIEKNNFRYKDQDLKVTMTFGLEEYSQIIGLEATLSKADVKLYDGKNNGRNQIVL